MMAQGFTRAYRRLVPNRRQNLCNLGHHSLRSVNARHKSGFSRTEKGDLPHLIEVELEPGNGIDHFSVKGLEEAIHGIIVRRAAPDWLPFVPGASYWVPPLANSGRIIDVVARSSNLPTDEETLSFTTVGCWPSSAYYIEGASPHPVDADLQKKENSEED